MNRLESLFSLLLIVVMGVLTARAQTSVGVVKSEPKPTTNSVDVTVESWTGEKFVFLPLSKRLQQFGYHFSAIVDRRFVESKFPYSNNVGKIIVVKKVEHAIIDGQVTFEFEDSGKTFLADTYKGQIDNIADVKELDTARERWLNKTIYSKKTKISTYDSEADKYGEITTTIGEPLKVINVQWGNHSTWPVWVVVQRTNNEVGYISTAVGWVNKYFDWRTDDAPWTKNFSEQNPRTLFKWSDADWQQIQEEKVSVGMTKEQVRWAWGEPAKKTFDITGQGKLETWIYGDHDQYLLFTDGILKVISKL